jgi:inner membrane protein
MTLGAAVGEAALGRRLGNRAPLWGALFGIAPDLDVVITPFVDPVGFIVQHRGVSHSLLAVAVVSPLLAWVFHRRRGRSEPVPFPRWLCFFVGVFSTHILLDCFTNYGTQIFWPFSDLRVAWNSIFIIDPLYTVPLLACVLICLVLHRQRRARRVLNSVGLVVSTLYLVLAVVVKLHMNDVFSEALARRDIEVQRLMTCPTPLNTVLWYGMAETESGYHVAFHSLLDGDRDVSFRFVPRGEDLLDALKADRRVNRLVWFADGYYSVRPHAEGIVLDVLKFGRIDLEGDDGLYPFSYLLRPSVGSGVTVERLSPLGDLSLSRRLGELWTRILGV